MRCTHVQVKNEMTKEDRSGDCVIGVPRSDKDSFHIASGNFSQNTKAADLAL